MEEEVDVVLKDLYKTDFDPFDLDDVELKPAKEEKKDEEEVKLEEPEVKSNEEVFSDEPEEEEEEKLSPELTAGIAIAKMLAEKKGVDDQIDWSTIDTEEDLENILDSFDDLDVALATERLKQSDDTVGKIVDYIEKGGKPDDILNLLTANKELREADISTESGCKALLKDYYKNVVKFSDDVIAKKIKRLEDSDGLADEAEDILPLYQEHLTKQIDEKQKTLEKENAKKESILKQQQIEFVSLLKANQFNRQAATELYNTAFSEVTLQSGEKKTLLEVKLDKLKANPEMFLKFISFANNPEQYDKQILANKGSQIVKEQTKKKLLFNSSKPKEAVSPTKSEKKPFQFKF